MANQDSFWYEREAGNDVVTGAVGSDDRSVQHLTEQVNSLRLQVATLQSGLDQSLQLQNALLQRLENQTHSMPSPETHVAPKFYTSTPAPQHMTHQGPVYQSTLSPNVSSIMHHPRLMPERFSAEGEVQLDDWLQSVFIYKNTCGLSDAQLFLELPRLLDKEPKKWFAAMQPHMNTWAQFTELFRLAFLPVGNQEMIWRGILDRVQRPDEPLPTFVTHLVGEFRKMRNPPPEVEQVEIILRHVSDRYRLALYGCAVTSIADLLLKAHEIHSALGPMPPPRQFSNLSAPTRQNLRCFNCSAPGVTTKNCQNCAERQQYREKGRDTSDPEIGEGATGTDGRSPRHEPGARPRNYQKNSRSQNNQIGNFEKHPSDAPPTVKLMQRRPRKPVTCDVSVKDVHVVAVVDSGASISAVRASTLIDCGVGLDAVLPYDFSDLELADSTCCTPTGLVWLPFQLLGQSFIHRFAVIPNLSCSLLLATDFMIPADVHIHPASNRVWLGDNASPASNLEVGDTKDLEGHITCLWSKDSAVDFRVKVDDAALPEIQKTQLAQELSSFSHIFEGKLGQTSLVEHSVDTGEAKPVCLPPYRASPGKRKIIEEQIEEMLKNDIIEPASGPWASPVVIVEVPSKEPPFCVDFRKVNKATVKDSYPLPRVDESLDFLARGKYISTLDLARGYWQVSMAPASRPKTAFISHKGLYQFKVMPFGLSNAPATFQRLMNTVLAGLIYNCCVVYLDDIVVASPTFEQHLKDLGNVLSRLSEAGLSLKLEKCHFCKPSLRYLGYVVTPEGLSPDESKVSAIRDFPPPSTVKQVKQFLGMTGYYRRFVSGYSKIAEPLISLTREGTPFFWSEECQNALELLKSKMCAAPILVLPNFEKQFAIHTDACDVGLGAALVQCDGEGQERAVAFASRTLHTSERAYSTSEKECLGVIWALEHFRPYFEGSHVKVVTDHNSLRWLMSRPSPTGRLARWCLRLQDFDFDIVHKPGVSNSVPDALSRNPTSSDEPVDLLPPYATVGSLNVRRQPLLILDDKEQLRSLQDGDEIIRALREKLESESCVDSSEFCLHNDMVYFRDQRSSCRLHPYKDLRYYVPCPLRNTLLQYFHDHPTAGHLGIAKTLSRLQKRVYWPGMRGEVKKYVLSCEKCQLTKPTNRKPAGYMQPVVASYPWEFAGVDFVGPLPRSTRGNEYILVFVDYFTKWVEICPVREATADVAARKFVSEVFARHGAPKYLVSDRGVQFVSVFFETVVASLGSVHRLTTAYHPQSNQTERVNRTIKTAIRAYVGTKHREWDLFLPHISFALRTAPHQSTGDTPAFLLYGRDLNTPLDLWLQADEECAPESMDSYKSELTSMLQDAYDHVRQTMAASHDTQKKYYDKRRRHTVFKVGDLVRLKSHPRSSAAAGFAAKLAPVYKGPYRVVQVMSDLNYRLVDNLSEEDIGVHHVSNLLPFFSWDDGAQASCNGPHYRTEGVPTVPDLEEPDEVEEYGFDFLFEDPQQPPESGTSRPFIALEHSHITPTTQHSYYFLRPRHKQHVATGR